mmetsp:Transcript_3744/g.11480  ORF Transcript_3744/g.11480 Transcript_3744/m.11480 type:complete len:513 (-) Transcript_3744:336-1874(-)
MVARLVRGLVVRRVGVVVGVFLVVVRGSVAYYIVAPSSRRCKQVWLTQQQQQHAAARRRRSRMGMSQTLRLEDVEALSARESRRSIEAFSSLPRDIRSWEPGSKSEWALQPHRIDLEKGPPVADPFALVEAELSGFADDVTRQVAIANPVLSQAAQHFFATAQGKRVRPSIVALLSRALPPAKTTEPAEAEAIARRQRQLGMITEMIHVASLIHDDVLDDADTRRGSDAIHKMFSNKVAVLSGDYLLARASSMLARLANTEVVEVMARALDSLVSGEIMQIKTTQASSKKRGDGDERAALRSFGTPTLYARAQRAFQRSSFQLLAAKHGLLPALGKLGLAEEEDPDDAEMRLYLRKSYFKTASLICDACKSTALLAGYDFESSIASASEEFGYHLGLAFQIIDDVLDFSQDSDDLGKPAGADLSLGLATAPILYAAQDHPELRPLIDRRFKGPGDVQAAFNLVTNSNGIDLAVKLATFHAQCAVDAICKAAPPSDARDALISLCYLVLTRTK